jgi:hypothetical protein
MTVAERGTKEGTLLETAYEADLSTDQPEITFMNISGKLNADLSIGADATGTVLLRSNEDLCSNGMMLAGHGFIINRKEADHILSISKGEKQVIKPYINGADLVRTYVPKFVVDFYGLDADDARRTATEHSLINGGCSDVNARHYVPQILG